jgi:hypothetical protein
VIKKQIIEDMKRVMQEQGRISRAIYREHGMYSERAYLAQFGSWSRLLRASGLTNAPAVVAAVSEVKMHLMLADIHYPEHDAAALKAIVTFIEAHKDQIASVTLMGDALDCADLSRHTKGKPRLRLEGGYKKALDGFTRDVLTPIEQSVKPGTLLDYIAGNHEDWVESDLLDEMPELDGIVNIATALDLAARGWTWTPCGGHIERAGFVLLHGDQIGSGISVAKKLVDSVNENCVMGHVHRFTVYTKTALVTERKKQIGVTLPCLCTVAPGYAKGQPNAFVVGFGLLEEFGPKLVNFYAPIILEGKFAFGGKVYGA